MTSLRRKSKQHTDRFFSRGGEAPPPRPSQHSVQCAAAAAISAWPAASLAYLATPNQPHHGQKGRGGRRAGVAEASPSQPHLTRRVELPQHCQHCLLSDCGANSRNTVSNCLARNLHQISFSVLWDPARMSELVEVLGNNRGKSFSSSQRRK